MAYYLAQIEFNTLEGKKVKEKAVVEAESIEESQLKLHKHLEGIIGREDEFEIKSINFMNQVTINI